MCTWETENRDSVTCETTSNGLTFKPESHLLGKERTWGRTEETAVQIFLNLMKKSTQRSKKLSEPQVTQRKMHIGTSVKLLKQRNKKINKKTLRSFIVQYLLIQVMHLDIFYFVSLKNKSKLISWS